MQTREFFEPGKDYEMFYNQDLVQKVRHYLTHEDERQAIAQSGYEKVIKVYNARNMWGYVFGKMGFEVPDGLASDENFKKHEEIMEALKCL